MAGELTDGELRRQLLAHGQKNIGPITATTRSIYIKKLNHLRVAAKKANNNTGKDLPSRKLLGFSSDESEGETVEPAGRSRSGAGRRKTSATVRAKTKTDTGLLSSTLGRAPLHRRGQNVPSANVSTTSAAGQVSLLSNSSSLSVGDYGSRAEPSRSRPTRDSLGGLSGVLGRSRSAAFNNNKPANPDRFDSSDSDVDERNDSYDLDITDRGSPEMISRSINTSPALDDSSLFSRTFGKLSGGRRSSYGRSALPPDSPYQTGSLLDDPKPISSSRVNPSSDLSTAVLTNRRYPRRSTSTANHPAASVPTGTDKEENSRTKSPPSTISTTNSWQTRLRVASNNVHRQQNRLSNHSVSNHIIADSDPLLSDEEDILQHGFKTREDPASYKVSQYISVVLLALAALFFIGLAGVYVAMNTPAPVANGPSNDDWMICPDAVSTSGACYPRIIVEEAREIVLEMATILSVQAGNYDCGLAVHRNLSKQDTSIRLVNRNRAKFEKAPDFSKNFDVALHLAIKNPHWKIKLYDDSGHETQDPRKVKWLESNLPHMGMLCRIHRSAMKIFYYVAALITVALATLLVISMIRHRMRCKEDEARHVYELVENIIEILRNHSESCQTNPDLQPYLAIPHVRDMLIPPKDRRKMQSLWDKAVKFLSASESRIRVETQKISGEEFAVWRWLQLGPSCYLEDQDASASKVWQGAAFGESSNNPPRSLTQCLKIRNMFDPDIECEENWHVNIQDAILEKVSSSHGNHGIVHIVVDKTSREGCVYVKFQSPEAAGKAYRALHGWWFDSNLVTVKYLRLERYHERFPDSLSCSSPLAPSNNQRRSLSQPFHRSIIESS